MFTHEELALLATLVSEAKAQVSLELDRDDLAPYVGTILSRNYDVLQYINTKLGQQFSEKLL